MDPATVDGDPPAAPNLRRSTRQRKRTAGQRHAEDAEATRYDGDAAAVTPSPPRKRQKRGTPRKGNAGAIGKNTSGKSNSNNKKQRRKKNQATKAKANNNNNNNNNNKRRGRRPADVVIPAASPNNVATLAPPQSPHVPPQQGGRRGLLPLPGTPTSASPVAAVSGSLNPAAVGSLAPTAIAYHSPRQNGILPMPTGQAVVPPAVTVVTPLSPTGADGGTVVGINTNAISPGTVRPPGGNQLDFNDPQTGQQPAQTKKRRGRRGKRGKRKRGGSSTTNPTASEGNPQGEPAVAHDSLNNKAQGINTIAERRRKAKEDARGGRRKKSGGGKNSNRRRRKAKPGTPILDHRPKAPLNSTQALIAAYDDDPESPFSRPQSPDAHGDGSRSGGGGLSSGGSGTDDDEEPDWVAEVGHLEGSMMGIIPYGFLERDEGVGGRSGDGSGSGAESAGSGAEGSGGGGGGGGGQDGDGGDDKARRRQRRAMAALPSPGAVADFGAPNDNLLTKILVRRLRDQRRRMKRLGAENKRLRARLAAAGLETDSSDDGGDGDDGDGDGGDGVDGAENEAGKEAADGVGGKSNEPHADEVTAMDVSAAADNNGQGERLFFGRVA